MSINNTNTTLFASTHKIELREVARPSRSGPERDALHNAAHIVINSTCKGLNFSISVSRRTVQLIRNPFLPKKLGNLRNLSFSDMTHGMSLLQSYLKFKLNKNHYQAAQEIKNGLIDQIKEKCSVEWGIKWITKATALSKDGIKDEFHEYVKLAEDPSFQKVLAFAANPKLAFLMKHMDLGFHIAAPLEWQICIHTFLDFINKTINNQVDERNIKNLIDSIANVALNYTSSDNLEFLLFLFPEIPNILELILEHPKNIALLMALLISSEQLPSLFGSLPFTSFSQYIQENHMELHSKDNLQSAFLAWLEQEPQLIKTQSQTKEIAPSNDHNRIETGINKLESIQRDLLNRNEKLHIGIALEYDQNQTTFSWLKKVLEEKLKALKSHYGDFSQIEWRIFLIDARGNKNPKLVEEINSFLSERSLQCKAITLQHLTEQSVIGKAEAVKLGLSALCSNCDIVGFIDLSNKINILEVGHLISSVYEDSKKGNEGIAIGSRRMAASQVKNKALTFLLRSTGLNWIVKSMFPLLYPITDTQTGFKFFSKNAWMNIQNSGLTSTSLAFDIEILQQAARLGLDIKQFPVNFNDNTQDKEGEIEGEKIAEMLKEILTIRAVHSDCSLQPFEYGEGRLLAGGAEHMVFTLEDGSLVKIPHERFDPHFFGFLKHVIFKNRDKMKWEDQDKKLISFNCIGAILDHPKFSQYIPLLRGHKEFNIFIMKVITNIENKSYQSLGYEISEKLGRDLVIPFCFIYDPFSLKLDGQWRTFSSIDQVKRTVSAHGIVKDQIIHILSDNCLSTQEKEEKILSLVDEAIDLFQSLWRRGMFDLDSNILADIGYYPNTQGQERLMILDSGEMLDDPSKINLHLIRKQVTQRYDFKELTILLKQLDDQGITILDHYQLKMAQFIDSIEEDLKKPKEFQNFGIDQKVEGNDFSLIMPYLPFLPPAHPQPFIQQDKTIEYFERSKTGFHMPYSRGIPSLHSPEKVSYPFLCSIPYGISTHPRSSAETIISSEKGSIGPTLQSLDHYDEYWSNPKTPSTLVILDAGSATRSSLLKYATERGTKGDLLLEGRSLYEHIAANFSRLLSSFIPEGYLVMASSDDLINLTESDCQRLRDYFHPANGDAPGFFWSEIPNYNEKYLPHTIADTIQMIREPDIVQLSETLLKQIPMLKGVVKAGHVKPILQSFANTLEKNVPFILPKISQITSKDICEPAQNPGYALVADLYQQLLQYQAVERLNGIKTPFFMIFKKEFLADFKNNILPLLPPSIYQDITWETILIRGIKMDKTIWMHNGKPSVMSSSEWEKLWESIQELKVRYHINVNCPIQGSLRSAKLQWQNFDDPYSLFMFVKSTYQTSKELSRGDSKVDMISDKKSCQNPGNIESNLPGTAVVLNSRIEGKVVIGCKQNKIAKRKHFESLFYNVQLSPESILYVPPNHLVVGIKGKIFSMKMGMISKEKLKTKSIYVYDQDGLPTYFSSYAEFSQ